MTYGALNTINMADVEHAWEAISDVSNVGLSNWKRQSLTCHFFPEPFKDPSGYISYFMILSILIR